PSPLRGGTEGGGPSMIHKATPTPALPSRACAGSAQARCPVGREDDGIAIKPSPIGPLLMLMVMPAMGMLMRPVRAHHAAILEVFVIVMMLIDRQRARGGAAAEELEIFRAV